MIVLEIKAFIIMINKELKLKYIKSLKSGGKVPKYLTAWGKLDEKKKAIEKRIDDWQWYLTPASKSKFMRLWRETGERPKLETSEEYTARRIKEEQDAAKKRTKHIKKAADTAHMIGTLTLPAGIAASAAVSLPATLGGIVGGVAGEKAVDYGLGKLADVTGSNVRSWKDLTDKYLGWSPTLLMLINPGTIIGGGIGAKVGSLSNKYYIKPGYLNSGINPKNIGKIPEIPEGYTFVREQQLSGRNGNRNIHLVKDNKTGKIKILEDLLFKSKLDWSKNWFESAGRKYKDGSLTEYNDFDIKRLESHVPEYTEIERKSKIDGTWLKMPDGSTWEGDPRSWVQYKSEAVQKHNPELFVTGIHKKIDPNYNERLWGLPLLNLFKLALSRARTYVNDDSKIFPMFTVKYKDPKQLSIIDAKKQHWQSIKDKNGNYIKTDDIVDDNSKKKVVKINNVIDIGDNIVPKNSEYYYEGIGNNVKIPLNDIVLLPRTFRKSLLGNNGDFKEHKTNMFRGLIPLITIGTGYSMYNQ